MKKIILSIIMIFGLLLWNSIYAINITYENSQYAKNYIKNNLRQTGRAVVSPISASSYIGWCKNPTTFIDIFGGWYNSWTMFDAINTCVANKKVYSAVWSPNIFTQWNKYEWKWVCAKKKRDCRLTVKKISDVNLDWKLIEKKDYDRISIKWTKENIYKTINSWKFNSPFIYFKNAPEWKFSVELNSKFDNYKAVPKLNKNNSWEWIIKNDKFIIDNKESKNLFYELELNKVTLNRNWKNFSSKEELINYLTKSDFFEKMWFTKEQKKNSLNYLLPKIKESPNYYLTILSSDSIENISKLKFSKKPDEFVRKFFAIYPTKTKVKTTGELIFPEAEIKTNSFKVIETWEILVNPDMFVFWKK